MESDTHSQPNDSYHDDETIKMDAHNSCTVTRNKDESVPPILGFPALSPSDARCKLSHMHILSCHLVSDIQNKMSRIHEDAVIHKMKLCKVYRDCHRLLEIEEEREMAESKNTEVKAINELQETALKLVQLMEDLQESKKTKEHLSIAHAQLKTLAKPNVGLDRCDSSVQLRVAKEMKHLIKPMSDLIQLDPHSAHPNLILSPDLRQVRFQSNPLMVKASKHCFEPGLYVLGMPGFQSGRHYWEVDVGYKSNWLLGVVRESVERKGVWELNSSNGFWVLRKQADGIYYGIGNTCDRIQSKDSPLRIGVCLDLFKNRLCFYDADTARLIVQLASCSAQEKLFPFFCPGIPMIEDDWCPLTLCI